MSGKYNLNNMGITFPFVVKIYMVTYSMQLRFILILLMSLKTEIL